MPRATVQMRSKPTYLGTSRPTEYCTIRYAVAAAVLLWCISDLLGSGKGREPRVQVDQP